jgi:hypothetical protein
MDKEFKLILKKTEIITFHQENENYQVNHC